MTKIKNGTFPMIPKMIFRTFDALDLTTKCNVTIEHNIAITEESIKAIKNRCPPKVFSLGNQKLTSKTAKAFTAA